MPDRLGRLLVHPLRRRLLLEYLTGPACPSEIAASLDQPLNLVAYHTQVLLRHGYLELVRSERRHGALARYYRSTIGPVIDSDDWVRLPIVLRRDLVTGTLELVLDDARHAARNGGFDHDEAHISRFPLELDDEGAKAVEQRLRAADDELAAIFARSRERTGPTRPYEVVKLAFCVENRRGA